MAEYIMRMEPEYPEYQVLVGALLRCSDCAYYKETDGAPAFCWRFRVMAESDGFCSYGEPREA